MNKNDTRTFTYQARLQDDLLLEEILSSCATLQGTMERCLFQELRKGIPINSIKSSFLVRFGATARQFNSTRIGLQGKIESLKQIRLNHIANLKEKISALAKKVPKIKKPFVRHQKQRRLIALTHKLDNLQQEKEPSLCFGGNKLFRAQFALEENGYSSLEEWKEDWTASRNSEFFLVGSSDETAGNQSCVLLLTENGLTLRLRIPNKLVSKYGKYVLIPIDSLSYGRDELEKARLLGVAITYRFKKDEKGWRVFISFAHEQSPVITKKELGAIGVDINVNHIALTEIDAIGNPVETRTIPLVTYGKTRHQAKALIGDACKKIIAFAKEKCKPVIVEKLDFAKKKNSLRETSSKNARMLSSFHYSQILQHIEAGAFREGVETASVNPAMTSIIGRIKFSKRYGLTVHQAAALCIARRFFSFSEASSKSPMIVVHKNVQFTWPLPERNRGKHVWSFWKEANRELRAALAAHFRVSSGPPVCRFG